MTGPRIITENSLVVVRNPYCSEPSCQVEWCWRAYCNECWRPIEAHAPTKDILIRLAEQVRSHRCSLSFLEASQQIQARQRRRNGFVRRGGSLR